MMPRRIQRQRTKGWRMPEGAVYVGRPSGLGNPWRVGYRVGVDIDEPAMYRVDAPITPTVAVALYRSWAEELVAEDPSFFEPLRGRDLACWCPLDQPCHADVLLELANRSRRTPTDDR